jgi:hypothetical protein
MDISFEGLNILTSTFCVRAEGNLNAFHYPAHLTFYLLSEITYYLLISANLSLAAGKSARINMSQAASGMILQNHRLLRVCIFRVKIAAFGSLKRVTGRIFKISK